MPAEKTRLFEPHEAVQLLHEHCCKSVKLYYGAKGEYPYPNCKYGVDVIWQKVYRYMYLTESVRMFVQETEKMLRVREMTPEQLGLTITKLFQLGTRAILPCALLYNVQGDRVSTTNEPSKVKPMSLENIKATMAAANLDVGNILTDYKHMSFSDLNLDILDRANEEVFKVRHAVMDEDEREEIEPVKFTKSIFTLPKIHINPSKTLILYIAGGKVIPRSKIGKRDICKDMIRIVLRTDMEGGMGAEQSLIPVVDFCQSCAADRQTQEIAITLPSTSASLATLCCTCRLPILDHCDIEVNPDMIHIPDLAPMLDSQNRMMVYAERNSLPHLPPAKDTSDHHKVMPELEKKSRFQKYIACTLPEQNTVESVRDKVAIILGDIKYNVTYAEYEDLAAKCVSKVLEKDMTPEEYLQLYYKDIAKVYIATCEIMATQLHPAAFFQTVSWAYNSKKPMLQKQIVAYVVELCKNYGTGLLKQKHQVKRSGFRRVPPNLARSLDEDVDEVDPIDVLPKTPEIENVPKFNFVTGAKRTSSVSSFTSPLSEMEVSPEVRKASSVMGESSGRRRVRDNSFSKRSRARSSSSCSMKKIKSVEFIPTSSESDSDSD